MAASREEQIARTREKARWEAQQLAERQLQERRGRLAQGLAKTPVNWKEEVARGTLSGVTTQAQAERAAYASAKETLRAILAKAGPMPDGY